nr:hypothetical protein [uncultured Nitrososphaera sp.]
MVGTKANHVSMTLTKTNADSFKWHVEFLNSSNQLAPCASVPVFRVFNQNDVVVDTRNGNTTDTVWDLTYASFDPGSYFPHVSFFVEEVGFVVDFPTSNFITITAAASISITPSTVNAGTSPTVACSGYNASEILDVKRNGTLVQSALTDSQGKVNIPLSTSGWSPGTYTIQVVGRTSGNTAQSTLTIQGASNPQISLSPSSVQQGQQTVIQVTGYQPGETLTAKSDGVTIATDSADAQGSRNIPYVTTGVSIGTHTISVTGSSSGANRTATLTVTQVILPPLGSIAVSLAPGYTPPFVTNQFFAAQAVLKRTDGTPFSGSVTVVWKLLNSTGGQVNSHTDIVTVPSNGTIEMSSEWAVASPGTYFMTATVGTVVSPQFSVSVQAPSINPSVSLSPTSINAGQTPVVCTFNGYTPNAVIDFQMKNPSGVVFLPRTISTDGQGHGIFTIDIATSSTFVSGTYTVEGIDRTTTISKTAPLQVTAVAPGTPQIQLTPDTAHLGDTIGFSLNNFGNSEQIEFKVDDHVGTPFSTDFAGKAVGTLTIDNGFFGIGGTTVGDHTVSVRGLTSGKTASTTLHVLAGTGGGGGDKQIIINEPISVFRKKPMTVTGTYTVNGAPAASQTIRVTLTITLTSQPESFPDPTVNFGRPILDGTTSTGADGKWTKTFTVPDTFSDDLERSARVEATNSDSSAKADVMVRFRAAPVNITIASTDVNPDKLQGHANEEYTVSVEYGAFLSGGTPIHGVVYLEQQDETGKWTEIPETRFVTPDEVAALALNRHYDHVLKLDHDLKAGQTVKVRVNTGSYDIDNNEIISIDAQKIVSVQIGDPTIGQYLDQYKWYIVGGVGAVGGLYLAKSLLGGGGSIGRISRLIELKALSDAAR